MFKNRLLKRIRSQTELIYQSAFLKRFSQLERYELLQLAHRRRYKSGEYVYHQADPGTGLYLIEQGVVELLYQETTDHDPVILAELHPPESFGAFSVDFQIRRKASARCITDCILYGFFISDYQVLFKRHPRIALRLLETINVTAMHQLDLLMTRNNEEATDPEAAALLFETHPMPSEESINEKVR